MGATEVRLIAIDGVNFDKFPCCGIKDSGHPGRQEKLCWLKTNLKSGVRAKTIMAPDGKPAGYIEYLPGEFAWRGVDCRGYMFIHCIWMHSRKHQAKGWATAMVQSCIDDARQSGMSGVAAMARTGPFMADQRLFLASGFEVVDTAPPDYQLLVRKIDGGAPNPRFRQDWEKKPGRYSKGLTIIRASQCPYVAKFADDIAEAAEKEYHIKPRVIHLKSCEAAQNAPTPYAVFSILYNGRVLADHQISRTRFRNIMNKLER